MPGYILCYSSVEEFEKKKKEGKKINPFEKCWIIYPNNVHVQLIISFLVCCIHAWLASEINYLIYHSPCADVTFQIITVL